MQVCPRSLSVIKSPSLTPKSSGTRSRYFYLTSLHLLQFKKEYDILVDKYGVITGNVHCARPSRSPWHWHSPLPSSQQWSCSQDHCSYSDTTSDRGNLDRFHTRLNSPWQIIRNWFGKQTLKSWIYPLKSLTTTGYSWKPLTYRHIKRWTNDDRFPLPLWETWFCWSLGVPIPTLIGPAQQWVCHDFQYDYICGSPADMSNSISCFTDSRLG